MPDYSDIMTVRQLIDLVALLQPRYTVVPVPQSPLCYQALLPPFSEIDTLYRGDVLKYGSHPLQKTWGLPPVLAAANSDHHTGSVAQGEQ